MTIQPHAKQVQILISPSQEPQLITSLPNIPPLFKLIHFLHTQVVSSVVIFTQLAVSPNFQPHFLRVFRPTTMDHTPYPLILYKQI